MRRLLMKVVVPAIISVAAISILLAPSQALPSQAATTSHPAHTTAIYTSVPDAPYWYWTGLVWRATKAGLAACNANGERRVAGGTAVDWECRLHDPVAGYNLWLLEG